MQHELMLVTARKLQALLGEMQSEAELFASANTLECVEACLLVMAQTLMHLSAPLQARLVEVDWHGWSCLQALLEDDVHPRRAELWYATQSLVPATLELMARLRRKEPVWFEIGF
jgi:hypothetical protein